MEDNFTRARLESKRKKQYMVKCLKNNTTKEFIYTYFQVRNTDNLDDLRKATFAYVESRKGNLDFHLNTLGFMNIDNEEINRVLSEIKANSSANFKYFYESYRRKIDKGYTSEFADNALKDLKVAYQTYRKLQNPQWDLESSQITEKEMENLYNILTNTKTQQDSSVENQSR